MSTVDEACDVMDRAILRIRELEAALDAAQKELLRVALLGSIARNAAAKLRPISEEMYGVLLEEYMSLDHAAAVSRNSPVYSSTRASADKLLDILLRFNEVTRIAPPVDLPGHKADSLSTPGLELVRRGQ